MGLGPVLLFRLSPKYCSVLEMHIQENGPCTIVMAGYHYCDNDNRDEETDYYYYYYYYYTGSCCVQ